MARIRYIKPEFFDDPVLAGCSQGARLLFIALWQVADRSGVFDPDTRKLKKYAFGYDACGVEDIERMLAELQSINAVCFGVVEGKAYGLIRNLKKHQKFHRDEQAHLEHVASTLVAGCKQGASTLVAALVTGNGQRVTETGNGQRVTETGNGQRVTEIPQTPKRKPKPASPPDADAPVAGYAPAVVCWMELYKLKYGVDDKWDGRRGRQLKSLLVTYYKPGELQRLMEAFFAWRRPEVIKGGHSFCVGYASFVSKIDELRADLADPARRVQAAQVEATEKNANKLVAAETQLERLAKRFGVTDEANTGATPRLDAPSGLDGRSAQPDLL